MPRLRRGTCILIRNPEGKYLLQFRDDTPSIKNRLMWDFFGGENEEGEDDIQSSVREIKEELSIAAAAEDFEVVDEIVMDDGEHVFVRYRPVVNWGDFTVREGAGCGFFTPAEIKKLNIPPYIRRFADGGMQALS